MNVMTGVMTD